jgi:hypothetical protein
MEIWPHKLPNPIGAVSGPPNTNKEMVLSIDGIPSIKVAVFPQPTKWMNTISPTIALPVKEASELPKEGTATSVLL